MVRYPHSTGVQVALDFNNVVSRSGILEGPSYTVHEYRRYVGLQYTAWTAGDLSREIKFLARSGISALHNQDAEGIADGSYERQQSGQVVTSTFSRELPLLSNKLENIPFDLDTGKEARSYDLDNAYQGSSVLKAHQAAAHLSFALLRLKGR
jgi:hypothetical protein